MINYGVMGTALCCITCVIVVVLWCTRFMQYVSEFKIISFHCIVIQQTLNTSLKHIFVDFKVILHCFYAQFMLQQWNMNKIQ